MLKPYKTKPMKRAPKKPQSGSVLIEALISVLIFSMGILALVGLQAAMIQNTSDNKYRADAIYIAQSELNRLWVMPVTSIASETVSRTSNITELPNGTRALTFDPTTGSITVTIGWKAPGGDAHQYQTQQFIRLNDMKV